MKTVWRAIAILLDPFAEWKIIEQEAGEPADLLSRYVALLALVPALFGFIGCYVLGVVVPGVGVVRSTAFNGLFGAIFGYVATFAMILLLGFLIDVLAPSFGGKRNFTSAFKLAVYSYTPVWLAGVFLLLPGLRFLQLSGFYGGYVLIKGLPLLMKSSPERNLGYAGSIIAGACVLAALTAAAQRAVFGTPGM